MAIRHIVIEIGVSGTYAARFAYSWQRMQWPAINFDTGLAWGDLQPRIIDIQVERAFTPQSLYGITTGKNAYTITLGNADGALDSAAQTWTGALGSIYAGENVAALEERHGFYIERVVITEATVILECTSAIEAIFAKRLTTEFFTTTFPLGGIGVEPRPWNAGHCTYDVQPISISGASTDFDGGSRGADIVNVFVNGLAVTPLAPLGSGAFSLATASVDGKRVTLRSNEPNTAAICTAGQALEDVLSRVYGSPTLYDATWSRGALDELIPVGVMSLDDTMLQTMEKILCGYDGSLIMRKTKPGAALLNLAGTAIASFVQTKSGPGQIVITSKVELEESKPEGLGRVISWNQNSAVHSRNETAQTDPNDLFKPNFSDKFTAPLLPAYDTDEVKTREFVTYFYDASTTLINPIAKVGTALSDTYKDPYKICTLSVASHAAKDFHPGDTVAVTYNRFGIGTNHKHQILSMRYSEVNLGVSFTLIGAYPI